MVVLLAELVDSMFVMGMMGHMMVVYLQIYHIEKFINHVEYNSINSN